MKKATKCVYLRKCQLRSVDIGVTLKIIIAVIITLAVTLLQPTKTLAVDLPINIEAITQQERPNEILTLRFNIDLFSDNSYMVNKAINEQIRIHREITENSLFLAHQVHELININYQILNRATYLYLFPNPVSFGSIGEIQAEEVIPFWVIIITLLSCAIIGYFIAYVISHKRQELTP